MCVLFLHVPKTAGTTFHSVLSFQYAFRPSFWTEPSDADERVRNYIQTHRHAMPALIRGHFRFGVHESIETPFSYITFLRDPVPHVRSQYAYYKGMCEGTTIWQNPIEQILQDSGHHLDNQQVRRISGVGSDKGTIDRNDLNTAIQNVDQHFSAIGLLEFFDDSLILMKHTLGWRLPLFYKTANVGKRRSEPSAALRSLIEETNRWDSELYAYVKQRLISDLRQIPDLEKRRSDLQRHNRILSKPLAIWRSLQQWTPMEKSSST